MGKRTKKTRWVTLPINSGDHSVHSDSEESNANSAHGHPRQGYHHHQQQHNGHGRPYYSKFPYSSQSTPIRSRFQNGHAGGGDTKSTTTRSSSTASENKITFNEDEYTRITTPRQDVLFKKGYLSKPKTYQTQTSTGNSTISTGNSTGNGTPDHQSADGTEGTDLEYESQFVFPNGFVDQNGIYYINSYEPYPPLVVYNAPYCYPEYPPSRSKRYSTDSLTESTSPHNEEASNHDPTNSGCENPVVNVVYNDCYAAPPTENGVDSEPRKVKKRRRRKASKPIPEGSTTSEESEAEEEETSEVKTSLKPDAKEFVPRAYRMEPPQYVSVPNFITLPPNFHPAFLPPINFIPPDPKLMQTFNVIPHYTPTSQQAEPKPEEEPPAPPPLTKNNIDIAKIVSKLEEAAKEQRFYEKKAKFNKPIKRINNYRRHEVRRREDVNNVNKSPEACSKMTKNYAQTLKAAKTPETPKKTIVVEVAEKTPVKQQSIANQWISVSRKKRKNKVEDEVEFEEEEEAEPVKDEEFESYDVNLLEDVVVPSQQEEDNKPVPEAIEEEQPKAEETIETPPTPADCEFDLLLKSLEEMELKSAKLAKKPRQTPKRVMVTDVDLSQESQKLEITEITEVETAVIVETQAEEIEPVKKKEEESPEKKRKAKKKKSVKTQKTLSNSSSSVTLNNPDDSYDFLLNNTLLEDEKTNVEISEELDKIIQRGMYNSLEEKIKSLNITAANDGFFKTISLTDKNDKQSLPSLSSLLKSTTNVFPKREVQLPELPTTTGSFLDVANVQEDPGIDKAEYPITKAVKDWMTKTRETTPEVEILKSPNTILKEISDDVTVWSVSPNDSIDLEWDEEIPIGEDVAESEEYVKIKAELEEKKRNGTFPKHANLPYRAICCSLM